MSNGLPACECRPETWTPVPFHGTGRLAEPNPPSCNAACKLQHCIKTRSPKASVMDPDSPSTNVPPAALIVRFRPDAREVLDLRGILYLQLVSGVVSRETCSATVASRAVEAARNILNSASRLPNAPPRRPTARRKAFHVGPPPLGSEHRRLVPDP
jgi:hypothetical protein